MGEFEITIDGNIIQDLILGDRDEAARQLLEAVFNEVLEAEMDEHLQAAKYERTEERQAERNGHYKRGLTMRVGPLERDLRRVDPPDGRAWRDSPWLNADDDTPAE